MDDSEVSVARVDQVGPNAVAITFETPADFEARPGQFVKVSVPFDDGDEPASRFYTISSPRVTGTFEITVAVDPDGDVGPELAALDPGDTVTLGGPYGNAYYEDEHDVVVLAGGPGVGPAVGIVERVLEDGGEGAIVYRDDEPIHRDRLDALAERGAAIQILGPDEDLGGSVREVLGRDSQVFVYGFADFLDAATSAIAEAGGEPDEAKVENFG